MTSASEPRSVWVEAEVEVARVGCVCISTHSRKIKRHLPTGRKNINR